jgi:sugar-specific transcriptional regulator TrmB
VIQILENFGFSRKEAIVYIYLAKAGPRKGRELRYGLKMTKQQLYYGLKKLHQKGIISRSSEHPALFSALAFEDLLNLFVRTNVEQAKTISETREEVLNHWHNLAKEINDYPVANQTQ